MAWIGGLAEWQVGNTVYLSVSFTWKVPEAWSRATFARAQGLRVIAGGPAFMLKEIRDIMTPVAEVPTIKALRRGKWRDVPAPHPDGAVIQYHNPDATLASRGCTEDCSFCGVPITEGPLVTFGDFPVKPVLCDNNLSALPAEYQDYIIRRYTDAGVPIRDANSGFEPHTFSEDVYHRWAPIINAGRGPWRFGYDELKERERVLLVMRMLSREPAKRKRVYVLIGNEPFADCMQRIEETIASGAPWKKHYAKTGAEHPGCEPHVQPKLPLDALSRYDYSPKFDWTVELLQDVARWANGFVWRSHPFSEYDRQMKERPILFSGPMIRGLLAGRKTQTRRIVKGVDECPHGYDGVVKATVPKEAHLVGKHCFALASGESLYLRCPYGVPGDRLWVRETFCPYDGQAIGYRADSAADYRPSTGWRPAIHMPRRACRLRLEVTAVRVERLFKITEADCRAEGMFAVPWNTFPGNGWVHDEGQPISETARNAFEDLWHSINGAWLDCWVWVIEFRREK